MKVVSLAIRSCPGTNGVGGTDASREETLRVRLLEVVRAAGERECV